eukprot:m.52353 g.52353  ORF g.52353 m.52353 type:complete len:136 (-) comp12693_c0_seq3:187-594(-)
MSNCESDFWRKSYKKLNKKQQHVLLSHSKDTQIRRLERDIKLLQADNERLTQQCLELNSQQAGNTALRKRIQDLEASLVAAQAKEVELQKGYQAQEAEWKRMYTEWMVKAEAKVKELQAANALIQQNLRRSRLDD